MKVKKISDIKRIFQKIKLMIFYGKTFSRLHELCGFDTICCSFCNPMTESN